MGASAPQLNHQLFQRVAVKSWEKPEALGSALAWAPVPAQFHRVSEVTCSSCSSLAFSQLLAYGLQQSEAGAGGGGWFWLQGLESGSPLFYKEACFLRRIGIKDINCIKYSAKHPSDRKDQ